MLAVENLKITFEAYAGKVQAVRGVSFDIQPGESVALVGESGCGKSVTAQSLMRLINAEHLSGNIHFEGQDVLSMSDAQLRQLRGGSIGMIFQDPMTALNPTMRIGAQIAEALHLHKDLSAKSARAEALRLLDMVDIPDPALRMRQYPHELSGGMRQRVCIAIALACRPKLLIADEPTTALDVTVQAQILERLRELQDEMSMAVLMITHDLGIVAALCTRVLVMYAGKIVESGSVDQIFDSPKHPYTQALLSAVPRLKRDPAEALHPIPGNPPDLLNPPPACSFAARCPHAMKICAQQDPELLAPSGEQARACWLYERPKV